MLPLLLLALGSLFCRADALGHPPSHKADLKKAGIEALDVYSSGTFLHLLVASYEDGKPVLLYQQSLDGAVTWSEFKRIDTNLRPAHSPRRGMDPQIAGSGDNLVAVWMTGGTDEWGGGPMATALSHDGGKSWMGGPNPADDNSTAGHGFIDIASDAAGVFHLTWLDTRNGKRGLRYARSKDGGRSWEANRTLDPETCECCWNRIAAGPDGAVAVLYRDSSPRDMRLAIAEEEGKSWKTFPMAPFNWDFQGCPHVGGGLAFEIATPFLHSFLWTGKEEFAGLYYVSSADLGRSWTKAKQIGAASASHPDIATGKAGTVAAVWDEAGESGSSIWASISRDRGQTWKKAARLSGKSHPAQQPRVVAVADGFRVFWTETSREGVSSLASKMLNP